MTVKEKDHECTSQAGGCLIKFLTDTQLPVSSTENGKLHSNGECLTGHWPWTQRGGVWYSASLHHISLAPASDTDQLNALWMDMVQTRCWLSPQCTVRLTLITTLSPAHVMTSRAAITCSSVINILCTQRLLLKPMQTMSVCSLHINKNYAKRRQWSNEKKWSALCPYPRRQTQSSGACLKGALGQRSLLLISSPRSHLQAARLYNVYMTLGDWTERDARLRGDGLSAVCEWTQSHAESPDCASHPRREETREQEKRDAAEENSAGTSKYPWASVEDAQGPPQTVGDRYYNLTTPERTFSIFNLTPTQKCCPHKPCCFHPYLLFKTSWRHAGPTTSRGQKEAGC